MTQRIKWLVLSKFGEHWPWYKKWWHYLTRSGKVVYLWPWERNDAFGVHHPPDARFRPDEDGPA